METAELIWKIGVLIGIASAAIAYIRVVAWLRARKTAVDDRILSLEQEMLEVSIIARQMAAKHLRVGTYLTGRDLLDCPNITDPSKRTDHGAQASARATAKIARGLAAEDEEVRNLEALKRHQRLTVRPSPSRRARTARRRRHDKVYSKPNDITPSGAP